MIATRELASPASGMAQVGGAALGGRRGRPAGQSTRSLCAVAVWQVVIFSGEVSARAVPGAAAVAIVAVAVAGQLLLAPPPIEEGHNVFLPGGPVRRWSVGCRPKSIATWRMNSTRNIRRRGAVDPTRRAAGWARVSRIVLSLFPPTEFLTNRRCRARWPSSIFPIRYGCGSGSSTRSATTGIPVSDVQRGRRDRRFWMGWRRWHLTMPWYEMVRLPAAYVGGELCWRGELMWESAGEHFALWPGEGCRTIEPTDAGRRIVGIAIKPDTLAMRLMPPWSVAFRIRRCALTGIAVLAVVGCWFGSEHGDAAAGHSDCLGALGDRHRRRQLPRRCTAVRRRRRWAFL